MFSWDLTITSIIIAAAAYYVAHNIFKTIKGATNGCSGCCSACSQCGLNQDSIGQKMALAIELSKQQSHHQ
ncbi:MAG: FeoB-associated Cys-rich membrane protein [Desulfuromusa sp.]|nr:FeoB-associated Cys-rich membrane protein [Desulfuromusa sp.]